MRPKISQHGIRDFVVISGPSFVGRHLVDILVLWYIPFFIFFYILNFVSLFHLIIILPVFCVSAAIFILDISSKISKHVFQKTISDLLLHNYKSSIKKPQCSLIKKVSLGSVQDLTAFVIISGITIFGLVSTSMLVTLNLNTAYFNTVTFMTNYLPENKNSDASTKGVTIISAEREYIWIPEYVFGKDNNNYQSYYWNREINNGKYLLIVDGGFKRVMSQHSQKGERLQTIYNNTQVREKFGGDSRYFYLYAYPYTSIDDHYVIHSLGIGSGTSQAKLELRTNY